MPEEVVAQHHRRVLLRIAGAIDERDDRHAGSGLEQAHEQVPQGRSKLTSIRTRHHLSSPLCLGARSSPLQVVDHLLIRYLIEAVVVEADGHERLRGHENHQPVDVALQEIDRLL